MSDLDAWRRLGTVRRPARHCIACGAGTSTGILWCMKCRSKLYYLKQMQKLLGKLKRTAPKVD